MSRFEYLSTLVSIVIALAISELIQGWGALIRYRRGARPYGLHVAWSVLGLLVMVQWWWGFWQYRALEPWSFLKLFALVTNAITVALFGYVLSGGHRGEPDLRAHYWQQHRWIFGLGAFAIVQLGVLDVVLLGQPLWQVENAIRALGVAALAALALSTSERLHVALTGLCYAAFIAFLVVAFRPL